MNISHKPMILCFVFTVLGSTLALAGPIMRSENGCRLHGQKTAARSCSDRTLHSTWPYALPASRMRLKMIGTANMILGNADPVLTLRRQFNA